jgi:hypothetical protein
MTNYTQLPTNYLLHVQDQSNYIIHYDFIIESISQITSGVPSLQSNANLQHLYEVTKIIITNNNLTEM